MLIGFQRLGIQCGVQTLTVYVNVSCVLVLSYAWVIFVSRAVCHALTYTTYTHAHTTDTCSLMVELDLVRVNDLLIIEFCSFCSLHRWKWLLRLSEITTPTTTASLVGFR